jgi:alkanesulfonate monooxygenase SsuD/methylene tetrahydromethanopterin reductase-like flavin-dependent oxidoreductase (luciferase family)
VQFGLLYMMYGHQSNEDSTFYSQVLEQVVEADALGYDCVWFAEHHFERGSEFCGRLPAPMLFVAAAAHRTNWIKLGTGVRVVSLHNPLIMAEEAAVADILSDGRLNLGAGQGTNPDLEAFGLEPAGKYARYREMLDVIAGAWQPGELTYKGAHFQYDRVCVIPKPLQPVQDMLWVAARDTDTIQYAARKGWPLLIGQAELTERQATYAETYHKAASAVGNPTRIGGTRLVHVAESTSQARDEIAECLWRYYRRFSKSPYYQQALADGLMTESSIPTQDEVMRNVSFIVGDPDDVADQLAPFCRALRVTTLSCMFHIAGMPHELLLGSMRLFIKEVKPRLLERLAVAA